MTPDLQLFSVLRCLGMFYRSMTPNFHMCKNTCVSRFSDFAKGQSILVATNAVSNKLSWAGLASDPAALALDIMQPYNIINQAANCVEPKWRAIQSAELLQRGRTVAYRKFDKIMNNLCFQEWCNLMFFQIIVKCDASPNGLGEG